MTREQLAVILYRYSSDGAAGGESSEVLNGFRDSDQVSAWARDAMSWAVRRGYLTGSGDGTLRPGESASRAQTAAVLTRSVG